jgi:hypothetical protein
MACSVVSFRMIFELSRLMHRLTENIMNWWSIVLQKSDVLGSQQSRVKWDVLKNHMISLRDTSIQNEKCRGHSGMKITSMIFHYEGL